MGSGDSEATASPEGSASPSPFPQACSYIDRNIHNQTAMTFLSFVKFNAQPLLHFIFPL